MTNEDEHPDIEVTVGVMVPMKWDAADECYKVSGKLEVTTGGLFSEAEESSWVPADGEWGAERPVEAERVVARLIARQDGDPAGVLAVQLSTTTSEGANMSVTDYKCATHPCDNGAVAVYISKGGAIYGTCQEHLTPLLEGERWVHPPFPRPGTPLDGGTVVASVDYSDDYEAPLVTVLLLYPEPPYFGIGIVWQRAGYPWETVRGPCIITGADGENPDDCTTHGHEADQPVGWPHRHMNIIPAVEEYQQTGGDY